jgi:Domain of unknown function (DUF4386)
MTGTSVIEPRGGPVPERSQLAYARFAGFMYLFILVFFAAAQLILGGIGGNGNFVETSRRIVASELLWRIGLFCYVIGSMATIPLAISLYVTLKPVDNNLAMMALLFRVVETAIDALWIVGAFAVLQTRLQVSHAHAFDTTQLGALTDLSSSAVGVGFQLSAAVSTLGSSIFFYLFLKSKYIPRILAAWGIFAALWFTAVGFVSLVLPQYSASAPYGFLPIFIAELSTGLWLLIVGIKYGPRIPTIQERPG